MALLFTPEQLHELAKRHYDRQMRDQQKVVAQEPADCPVISEDSKEIILALLTKLREVFASKVSRCEADVEYWKMRCAAPIQVFRADNAHSLAVARLELSAALAHEEAAQKALDEFNASCIESA